MKPTKIKFKEVNEWNVMFDNKKQTMTIYIPTKELLKVWKAFKEFLDSKWIKNRVEIKPSLWTKQ